jgi:hypothetical protein
VESYEQVLADTTGDCHLPPNWLTSIPASLVEKMKSKDDYRYIEGNALQIIVVPPDFEIGLAMSEWSWLDA